MINFLPIRSSERRYKRSSSNMHFEVIQRFPRHQDDPCIIRMFMIILSLLKISTTKIGYKTLRLISLKRKIEDDFPIHIRMSMWDPYRTRKSVYEHAG